RANPKKTKAIADMQSPRTLKEMQSLRGNLAALNRFLAQSTKRSLPFFNTLKNITKGNKDEYRWAEEAEESFQEMKKVIVELPLLTTPKKEETLYVYLAGATYAVSAVLLTERKGKQCPVHYVDPT
ncbi:reverse transcriptase domain-containing protein, partial [Tanacetum coccineum]